MNLKLGNNECTFARWKVASLPMLVTLSFQVCIWLLYNDHENLLVIDQQINLHTAFKVILYTHDVCSVILLYTDRSYCDICIRGFRRLLWFVPEQPDLWKNPEPCTKLKFMGVHFVEDVTAPRCAAHVGAEASRSFGSSLRHPPLPPFLHCVFSSLLLLSSFFHNVCLTALSFLARTS